MIEKYNRRVEKANSLVGVSLDSDISLLPPDFRARDFPQFEFNKRVIDLTNDHVGAYKLNIAFYESRGPQGFGELKATMEYLKDQYPDIPTICDAKRGDVLNTNEQYAATLFDYFGFDAATVNPYLGKEPLEPFLRRKEKGCIVVCRTSNPGAGEIQDLNVGGKPIWSVIARKVKDDWNANGNCLLVVGATYPEEMKAIREIVGDMTFLVPGVGAQGGDLEAVVRSGLNSEKKGLIIVGGRSFIFAADPGAEVEKTKHAVNALR